GSTPPLAAPARKVARLPGGLRLSRPERDLRAGRVARRGPRRLGGRRLPRHPGRCLGHAVGHVHGPDRCDLGAAPPVTRARSTAREARRRALSERARAPATAVHAETRRTRRTAFRVAYHASADRPSPSTTPNAFCWPRGRDLSAESSSPRPPRLRAKCSSAEPRRSFREERPP